MPVPVRPGQPVPVQRAAGPGDPQQIRTNKPKKENGEEEEDDPQTMEKALRRAPPWLVSTVVHMILVIVMMLIIFVRPQQENVELISEWTSDVEGEQLEDDSFVVKTEDPAEMTELVLNETKPVDDPFAAPVNLDVQPIETGTMAISNISAPSIGMALDGRNEGMKKALLGKYGGTPGSEKAVKLALDWLKKQQDIHTGSWSLRGPYPNGSDQENTVAATAMALLAFQGAGHTHQKGEYRDTVKKGWEYLLQQQQADGDFYNGEGPWTHHLYTHGQCTIAACEMWAMSKDPKYKGPAEKAVSFAISAQDRLGGWRYAPGNDSDTSVTGWLLMGLQSARMAGIEVPNEVFERAGRYLDKAASQGGAQYGYQAGASATETMTAEALLCRQYLGWRQNEERMTIGADYLLAAALPNWQNRNVYYWYYATQMFHHLEGARWDRWNGVMRDLLVRNQVGSGPQAGSWAPDGDQWGAEAGRLYTTCLSVFILEVYYRHLPLYSKLQ